ncbi:phage repressor protein [Halalkalicoccus subterraneus]|uniref:phage repressor protein n=1 Tax=Halalkalicoccus subterraneus TaxID=2675002 RepID=UPI000EFB55C5|nr:phage repressor protein [Halalkalicoccus subterraneus]
MADGVLSRLLQGGFREQNARLRIDWMTHTDERILELLAEEPATPSAVATRLEKSEEYVADRCRQLATRELLAREDGVYRLAQRGRRYLDGELDPEKLADDA